VTARAAIGYDRAAAALVAAWKEHGIRKLAAEAADLVAETVERPAVQALSFVPPDGDRSIRRGHHPAQRLAVELGLRWELPVENLVARRRRVERQRGLSIAQRRANVAGAFRPRRRKRVPIRVALVDDVFTTGATASAAASALRAGGAREVHVITLARAVRVLVR
jgi:predicted amidophosphoribosyltransferase